jgi:hypothetical protein
MYIVRDTMFLKFGHFRDAKALMGTALKDGFMPEAVQGRILSDFTGHAYRFILEQSFRSLTDYEQPSNRLWLSQNGRIGMPSSGRMLSVPNAKYLKR